MWAASQDLISSVPLLLLRPVSPRSSLAESSNSSGRDPH